MEMIEMVEVPFEGYSKRIKEVTIGGKTLFIKPKVSDSEAYMLLSKELTEKNVKQITNIFTNMVKRAYVEQGITVNDEDLSDFIAENYGEFFTQSAVFFGFMSKEEMDAAKKKVISKGENQA
jgi:uncharacterized protein YegJ (DUF2314 family)